VESYILEANIGVVLRLSAEALVASKALGGHTDLAIGEAVGRGQIKVFADLRRENLLLDLLIEIGSAIG